MKTRQELTKGGNGNLKGRGCLVIALLLTCSALQNSAWGAVNVIFPSPGTGVTTALARGYDYALGWWTTPGIPNVKIELLYFSNVEYVIVDSTLNNGKYIWHVPPNQHLNSDYHIRISDATNPAEYGLSGECSVGDGSTYIEMLYPFDDDQNAQAARWQPFEVRWASAGSGLSGYVHVQLWYMTAMEQELAHNIADTGSFIWDVPQNQHLNSDYRVLVVDAASPFWRAATTEFSVTTPCGPDWALHAAVGPAARHGVAMANDSSPADSGVTLLFGGEIRDGSNEHSIGDTWQWDGSVWTSLTSSGPTARGFSSMVYDEVRGESVLFGGVSVPAGTRFGDTWTWNGSEWTEPNSVHSPIARAAHAMTYDRARGVTVLFGGGDGSNYLSDTWEWNGTDWTQITTAHTPPGRAHHSLAYDSCRQVVVLFGGQSGPTLFGDTWEYDGVDWVQRTPAHSPAVRHLHRMSFDRARCRTVLFGGMQSEGSGIVFGDTWEWDGTDWVQTLGMAPSPRAGMGMVYDAHFRTTVLFGGHHYPNVSFGDTFYYGVPCMGDMNCDGVVTFDDINVFVLALGGATSYYAVYPDCNWWNADCDGNGTVSFDDIDPFITLLTGQ